MNSLRNLWSAGFIGSLLVALPACAQQAANPPLPQISQLLHEVQDHQKTLEKVRENYTYSSMQTMQDMDARGQVTKTETREFEIFFVNGREIRRLVKKDGKPLDDHEQQKETERVTKAVEEAQKPHPEQSKTSQEPNISRILEIVEVRNPRRETYRGRPAIVFDFVGRKDASTHGLNEEVYKKLQGTAWVDEQDREVVHIDVTFDDNFHVGGGLLANVEKGSNFHFDQAPVNNEVWLQTGAEGTVQARVLLVKGIHQHFAEHDSDYKRFKVETQQGKDAKALVEAK